MAKPKVLMLGWEFPPVISGGLGMASLGLSRALAELTQLSFIAPQVSAAKLPKGTNFIGLDQLHAENFPEIDPQSFSFIRTAEQQIPAYSPYETAQVEQQLSQRVSLNMPVLAHVRASVSASTGPFGPDHTYGAGLLSQVIAYSELATQVALQTDFDLIHAHDWMTFVAAVEIKRQTGKPLVLHLHSMEYDRNGPKHRGWVFELEQQAMQAADLIIPVSSYTAQLIRHIYSIKAEKIVAIHNGLDNVEPYRKAKAFPEKLLVFLGRMTDQKNPRTFFQMAVELLRHRKDVRFVMAGTGHLSIPLMQEVARLRLGDRIHFTGFLNRQDVYDLLAMTDILVMPSRSEPFGLAALEAAAFGVSCVISQYAGVAEVLTKALRVEPSEVPQIVGHVERLLDDDALRKQLGLQLQAEAAGMSWAKAAQKVLEAYQIILNN